MTTSTQQTLTLDNFHKVTGLRFRVTNEQQARIFLTGLSDNERAAMANMDADAVAYKADKPKVKWMELVGEMAANWTPDMALTREQAFEEFIADGGLERLQGRKPDVPLSVYQDPNLSLENFSDKVEAATGRRRRFRLPTDLASKVRDKEMTREQGFQETVRRVLTNAQQEEQTTNE